MDGYIARKYNLVTKWGMVIDPLADKLMLLTVLICLAIKGLYSINSSNINCGKRFSYDNIWCIFIQEKHRHPSKYLW